MPEVASGGLQPLHCAQCGAGVAVPSDTNVLSIRCEYCGTQADVPDRKQRMQVVREKENEVRLEVNREARRQHQEVVQKERRKDRRRAEARESRGWLGQKLFILAMVLIGPSMVVWQTTDVKQRYFGSTGEDRLRAVADHLIAQGCRERTPATVTYAGGEAIVHLVDVAAAECITFLAAGGEGHDDLQISLFAPDGKRVGRSPSGTDARLRRCVKKPGSYRLEIRPGRRDKGRLTHSALTCP